MSESRTDNLQDLILVAGHAAFKESTPAVPDVPERDDAWCLQSFQIGEPPFYIEHIRRGVILLANNPAALLILSGGHTRVDAGHRWSEGGTYAEIAKHFKWWVPESDSPRRDALAARTTVEKYARDSFENLLFALCRFQQVVGKYPRNVTVVSWAFKRARFDFHRAAIRFSPSRFRFDGFNDPLIPQWANEATALHDFIEDRYGSGKKLGTKRAGRNPFNRAHDYRGCVDLGEFFKFIEEPENGRQEFMAPLPWDD